MNKLEAKEYIKMYFEFNSEAYSIFQEVTKDGYFTLSDVKKFDDETMRNVADDLRYQVRSEIGYLIN